jgi:hypothetical protein
MSSNASDNVPKLKRMIMDEDEMALGHIKCHVSPSFLDLVIECKTALEAWKKLETFFNGKEKFNKFHLL